MNKVLRLIIILTIISLIFSGFTTVSFIKSNPEVTFTVLSVGAILGIFLIFEMIYIYTLGLALAILDRVVYLLRRTYFDRRTKTTTRKLTKTEILNRLFLIIDLPSLKSIRSKDAKKKLKLIKAVKISVKVWTWLAKTGLTKKDLPSILKRKVKNMDYMCPLCELFIERDCENCPLGSCETGSSYDNWRESSHTTFKKEEASKVLNTLKSWLKENE